MSPPIFLLLCKILQKKKEVLVGICQQVCMVCEISFRNDMIQSDTAVLGRSMIFMNNSLFNKMNLSEL